MKIDKNNYEAYILDYLEGTLSESERGAMELFAFSHPELGIDLTVELPQISFSENTIDVSYLKKTLVWNEAEVSHLMIAFLEARIDGVALSFSSQHRLSQWETAFSANYSVLLASLKKTCIQPVSRVDESLKAGLVMLPEDHVDFKTIAYLEGDLSVIEHAAYEKASVSDSKLHLSLLNYKKTIVLPTIEGLPALFKNELKQKGAKVIPVWFYRSIAAAAVVLFGFFFLNNLDITEAHQNAEFNPRTQPSLEQLVEQLNDDETDSVIFRNIEPERDEAHYSAETIISESSSGSQSAGGDKPLVNEGIIASMDKSYALVASTNTTPVSVEGGYLIETDYLELAIHKALDADLLIDEAFTEEFAYFTPLGLVRRGVLNKIGQEDEQSLAMSLVNRTAKKLSDEKEDFIAYEKATEGKNGFKLKLGKFSLETIR